MDSILSNLKIKKSNSKNAFVYIKQSQCFKMDYLLSYVRQYTDDNNLIIKNIVINQIDENETAAIYLKKHMKKDDILIVFGVYNEFDYYYTLTSVLKEHHIIIMQLICENGLYVIKIVKM